jgi:hypothetical protein
VTSYSARPFLGVRLLLPCRSYIGLGPTSRKIAVGSFTALSYGESTPKNSNPRRDGGNARAGLPTRELENHCSSLPSSNSHLFSTVSEYRAVSRPLPKQGKLIAVLVRQLSRRGATGFKNKALQRFKLFRRWGRKEKIIMSSSLSCSSKL